MAKTLGIVAVALVLAGVLFIGTRPDRFRVERSAQVDAPPDVAFSLINDFHQWQRWSPYEKLDPNLNRTYEGPAAGPGAVYSWKGNNNIGEGRMTILASNPGERVSIKLEFFKPFSATNTATFKLVPSESGTRVAWIMEGENSLMGKAMSAFMDMDKMIGKDFEQGLANLGSVAQAETEKRKSDAEYAAAKPAQGAAPAPATH